MKQAEDFRTISEQVDLLIADLPLEELSRETAFKGWTVEEIVRHIHVWNLAAHISLTDPQRFDEFWNRAVTRIRAGQIREFEAEYVDGRGGQALLEAWHEFYPRLANAFAKTDPKMRVAWAGPSMSARSSITARLMETWSHAQAIYDAFGIDRPQSAAIENIVVLGHNTYGWTFANRGLQVPVPKPQVVLNGPGGEEWVFGEGDGGERVSGSAHEFCQVVTQCRNIADTSLKVVGPNAAAWMEMAQCFAGPPQDPPPPGARAKA